MGELGNVNDPEIHKILDKIKMKLDIAFSRGDPIIILETGNLKTVALRMAVEVFVNTYVKKRHDRIAYLRSMN